MSKQYSVASIMLYCSLILSVSNTFAAEKKSVAPKNERAKNRTVTILPEIKVVASNMQDGDIKGYKAGSSTSSMRTDTKLIDTPQSISVVTQNQIRDQNIANMEEAVRYVAGVNIQQGEGNRDQLSIRGNNTTADFFVDGARDDLQYFRDFYNTDRVEFLKGPNALSFGRGGTGGVVNRVLKYADGEKRRHLVLTGGSFDNRRVETDLGDQVSDKLSLRLNSVYEKSNTFRRYGDVEKFGFNPTAMLAVDRNTDVKFGYEFFKDQRFNDRGLPSSSGGALKANARNFVVGNPNENQANVETHSVYAIIDHKFSENLKLRNLTRFNHSNKFYQNVFANSAVNTSGNFDLAAYNDTTTRNSFTNQTDLTKKFATGSIRHTALLGAEITSQSNRTLRRTGLFDIVGSPTALSVSINNPINFTPITYTNRVADNNSKSNLNVLATYLQDQIDLNNYAQLVAGLRFDRFEMNSHNLNTNQDFKRIDNLISPRAALIFKPCDDLSFYTSYGVTYLPSSGEQFSNLSVATVILQPEKIQNYEIGAKWDVNSRLNLAAALYQLDRSNSRAQDPNRAGFFLLTGESRTRGLEFSATGKITDKWQIIAGYNYQEAKMLSNTSSTVLKGNKMALTPISKISLWNKYDFNQQFGAAIGIIDQSSQFAAADNAVRLKGFTRFDGAVYYRINPSYRVQVNVENIFDHGYILTAHNNNNIQPGSTRAFKASLVADF